MTTETVAYTSRYTLGQRVWWMHTWEVPGKQPCPTCGGTSRVRLAESERTVLCPENSIGADPRIKCRDGQIHDPSRTEQRAYIEPRTIGQVRIQVTEGQPAEVTYMAYESGIGSGSILPEEKLYPSYEDAKAAAGAARVVAYGQSS